MINWLSRSKCFRAIEGEDSILTWCRRALTLKFAATELLRSKQAKILDCLALADSGNENNSSGTKLLNVQKRRLTVNV